MAEQSWLQLVCHTSRQFVETIESKMQQASALSITLKDAADTPVLEPLPGETPLWNDVILTALFESDTKLDRLRQTLDDNKAAWNIHEYHLETVTDQDWERVWMDDFHPMRFGDDLWIYPSNSEIPDDTSTKILLDPGLAFGTGTHATTALCLEWLDQNPPIGKTVIDYGCGSGILAIAAAKLQAKYIIATDIDNQALIATRDNMQRNQIGEEQISCYLPEALPQAPVDLLLANILCGPLHELFPLFSALTRSGGKLVLSGILREQSDALIGRYSAAFIDFEMKDMDGWVRISATKS